MRELWEDCEGIGSSVIALLCIAMLYISLPCMS